MSAVAHFFVAVSGSFIHERMAQLFVDIYKSAGLKVGKNFNLPKSENAI